jgi:MFS family permease
MSEILYAILFCCVFASQVLMISWLYPRRLVARGKYVLQNFPPATHPKLYPRPTEHYERWLRNYARLNLAIVAVGVAILLGLILGTPSDAWIGGIFASSRISDWNTSIVGPLFVVQMLAATSIEIWNFIHLKAMAKAPLPRVRTTELHRRRLVDFVSPGMLALAAIMNIAFIAFILFYVSLEFPWFPPSKATILIRSIVFTLVVFSVTIAISLRGPKHDPYQTHQDRLDLIKLIVQQAVRFFIAFPILATGMLILKSFEPDLLEPTLTSLTLQGIALATMWGFYNYRADKVDYGVYRLDTGNSLGIEEKHCG